MLEKRIEKMRSVLLMTVLVGVASGFKSLNDINDNRGNNFGYSSLVTEFEWKYFDYIWRSPEHKKFYIDNNLYDPGNMAPIDVDRSIDGRTFVTVIRASGVPASLHTVSRISGPSGPLLVPYPDWSWYENPKECRGITSVFRVAIDQCNRMWVLDTGKIGEDYICPAQLLLFDLKTDRLIYKLKIPNHIARNRNGIGLLITPIVEAYGDQCENTTVYMADVQGHALVVWDGCHLTRLEADVYEPEERYANFTIAGESFYLADGVLGMALSPLQASGDRYLAFRPLASRSLYAADTRALRLSRKDKNIKYYRGHDVLPSQASAMAFTERGTLFYGLTSQVAIGCWSMHTTLEPRNFKIALVDYEKLQFTSGMKVKAIKNPFSRALEEQLLVMTNRLQKIYAGTQHLDEINYRVMRVPVQKLIQGTGCDPYY